MFINKNLVWYSMARRRRVGTEKEICSVDGCNEHPVRSISTKRYSSAVSRKLKSEGRRVHLCKEHYREFKKKTKKDRMLDSLGWER